MSKNCLEFLFNSFLFETGLSSCPYNNYSDNQIMLELQKYREYVINNFEEIKNEIHCENEKLNINIESFGELPTIDIYKQLVLYMDQVVIPDPIFELTEIKSNLNDAMGQIIGLPKSEKEINREKIVEAVNYVKCISELIKLDFVVLLPLSLMHETPKETPITYSPTAFADALPQDILNYYRSIVQVYNLKKSNNGLQVVKNSTLVPSTKILVEFEDNQRNKGAIYSYMDIKVLDCDDKTGKIKMAYRLADSISEDVFKHWVNQSINQTALHHFSDRYKELIFAKKCGCMYLSQSTLTANILNMAIEKPEKKAELATMAMKIDLPVIDSIPITDIIEIRRNYGEAFHNFRNELNSKLLTLDNISNEENLQNKIDNITYELNELQVKEVKKEYRKIIKKLQLDAIAFSGSLIASFATGGITAIGAAAAFVKGATDISKYLTDVNEHNGFFLWKINKQAEKYTI